MELSPRHISRRQFSGALGVVLLTGCSTLTHQRVASVLEEQPIDRIYRVIQQTQVSYNGKLLKFPNDARILGPDEKGLYTITSAKLRKVTNDSFQFDANLNLVTRQITINIDSFDLITVIAMRTKFGLENGNTCSVAYENQVLVIKKI